MVVTELLWTSLKLAEIRGEEMVKLDIGCQDTFVSHCSNAAGCR